MYDSVQPHRWQPSRLPHPWNSPGKNIGGGCHFLLQCVKVKSESEVAQSCLTLSDPMNCSLPGSSTHGIFQARVLEWGAIAGHPNLAACAEALFFSWFKMARACGLQRRVCLGRLRLVTSAPAPRPGRAPPLPPGGGDPCKAALLTAFGHGDSLKRKVAHLH